jgi:hypothetical protein
LGGEQGFAIASNGYVSGCHAGISVVGCCYEKVTVSDGVKREFTGVEVLQHLFGEIGSMSR